MVELDKAKESTGGERLGKAAKAKAARSRQLAEVGLLADATDDDLEKRKKELAAGERKPATPTKCAYLTDVEGDWNFFCRYVENSEVLEWEDKEKKRLKFKDTAHDTMLVFGGNSQDNRAHSYKVLLLLTYL